VTQTSEAVGQWPR